MDWGHEEFDEGERARDGESRGDGTSRHREGEMPDASNGGAAESRAGATWGDGATVDGGPSGRARSERAPSEDDGSGERPRPDATSDLVPSRLLYVAEFVMLPFFWLAPLALLVLGGTMAYDIRRTGDRLEERYDCADAFDSTTYLYCLLPFVSAHLGTVAYRAVRLQKFRGARGFSASAFSRQVDRLNPSSIRIVGAAFGLQLLGLVALLFPVGGLDTLYAVGLLSFVVGLLVAPLAVWYDLRSVRRIEHVDWGWPRYLHVLFGWLPGSTLLYFLCRNQQVYLAALIDVWTVDPAAIEPAPTEKSRTERFSDWLDERL